MIENPVEQKNKLLREHASGKITLDELMKECAYWYKLCFPELHVKPLPTPPKRYLDYSQMDYLEKKEVPKEFWLMPEIKDYLNQKDEIKNENKAVLYHLKEYIKYIPEQDFLAISEFNEKINEFEEQL